jgi:hypothetical protein
VFAAVREELGLTRCLDYPPNCAKGTELKVFLKKLLESFVAVLPITVVVMLLAWLATDITWSMIGLFIIGALLLVFGMTFFSIGAEIAMIPIGNSLGGFVSRHKKIWLAVILCLFLGTIVTVAEPDLMVLSELLGSKVILYSVAVGVGLFLVVSLLRNIFKIKLKYLFFACYLIIFILAAFVPQDFVAFAFDSGGVTTGAITVPFLMSFGIGMAAISGSENNHENSFGVLALCSIGPVIAVLIVGLTGKVEVSADTVTALPSLDSFKDILMQFINGSPDTLKEVAISISPIVAVFFIFQIFALRLPKAQVIRICVGILYTFIGVFLFLLGVNIGFMPMGAELGAQLASSDLKWLIIPCGMLMGSLIVLAEPAIHVLNQQIEEVTGGSISRKSMLIGLCTGISIFVGLSFVRVLTGISIWYFIVPVYAVSIILSFFVPSIFTGIAFDSGGVASGSMTAAFLLPMAIGACKAVGGNVLTDAYGMIAFVAMAPLLTIQIMGLIYSVKLKKQSAKFKLAAANAQNLDIIYAEEPVQFGDDIETEVLNFDDETEITDGYDSFPSDKDGGDKSSNGIKDVNSASETSETSVQNNSDNSLICELNPDIYEMAAEYDQRTTNADDKRLADNIAGAANTNESSDKPEKPRKKTFSRTRAKGDDSDKKAKPRRKTNKNI